MTEYFICATLQLITSAALNFPSWNYRPTHLIAMVTPHLSSTSRIFLAITFKLHLNWTPHLMCIQWLKVTYPITLGNHRSIFYSCHKYSSHLAPCCGHVRALMAYSPFGLLVNEVFLVAWWNFPVLPDNKRYKRPALVLSNKPTSSAMTMITTMSSWFYIQAHHVCTYPYRKSFIYTSKMVRSHLYS